MSAIQQEGEFLERIEPDVRAGRWDRVEDQGRDACVRLSGSAAAKEIESVSLGRYEDQLRSGLKRAVKKAAKLEVPAVYFEYELEVARSKPSSRAEEEQLMRLLGSEKSAADDLDWIPVRVEAGSERRRYFLLQARPRPDLLHSTSITSPSGLPMRSVLDATLVMGHRSSSSIRMVGTSSCPGRSSGRSRMRS